MGIAVSNPAPPRSIGEEVSYKENKMNQRNLVVRLSNATTAAFVRHLRLVAMLFLLLELPLMLTMPSTIS